MKQEFRDDTNLTKIFSIAYYDWSDQKSLMIFLTVATEGIYVEYLFLAAEKSTDWLALLTPVISCHVFLDKCIDIMYLVEVINIKIMYYLTLALSMQREVMFNVHSYRWNGASPPDSS